MKKFVGVFGVKSFHKDSLDRKFGTDEERVTTTLLRAGYSGVKEDIFTEPIVLNTKDSQSPDWGEYYIVTVERLDAVPVDNGYGVREGYFNGEIEKKRNEGVVSKPLVTGRKFR